MFSPGWSTVQESLGSFTRLLYRFGLETWLVSMNSNLKTMFLEKADNLLPRPKVRISYFKKHQRYGKEQIFKIKVQPFSEHP